MDSFASELKITLRLILALALFILRRRRIPLNFDIDAGQVRDDKPIRIVRAYQLTTFFGQVGLLVFLVDNIVQILLQVMCPGLVVIRIHIQVEFLEPLANGGVLHHAHELAVRRHAPLDLVKLGRRLVRIFVGKILLREGLFGLFSKLVALPQLSIKKLHDLGLHLIEGQRVVLPHRPGNDQRRPGLVDQDGIRFVNNAKKVITLNLVLLAGRHSIVPQVVESEFGSGAVGNVAFIHFAALGRWHVVLNASDRQTEVFEKSSHPMGISQGQVIINRYKLTIFPTQRVQVEGAG